MVSEKNLKQVASILKRGNCGRVYCAGVCPVRHGMTGQIECSRNKETRHKHIDQWMKENNVTKADLIEYMLE